MIYDEFLDILRDLFPSLYDDHSIAAVESIKQFFNNKEHLTDDSRVVEQIYPQLVTAPIADTLSQGDIISDIPFYYINKDGDLSHTTNKGLIISSTCDIENDDNILISPCYSINDLKKFDRHSLIKNMKFSFFSLNNSSIDDESLCADFSRITSFSKVRIIRTIAEKRIKKLYSLSLIGYYLFIIKLCVHLLRKEDSALTAIRLR